MVEENDRLLEQIQELEVQLAEAQQKVRSQPNDVTSELRESKRLLKKMEDEATQLESELADLREEKMTAERKLDDYKKKYPLN